MGNGLWDGVVIGGLLSFGVVLAVVVTGGIALVALAGGAVLGLSVWGFLGISGRYYRWLGAEKTTPQLTVDGDVVTLTATQYQITEVSR